MLSVSECMSLLLNWKFHRFSNGEGLTTKLGFLRKRYSVFKINDWRCIMSSSRFQYFIIPVLTCILPGLDSFSLEKRRLERGLILASHICQTITRKMEPGFSQGYLVGAQETRGISWNRRDSGWTRESCPLHEDGQALERVARRGYVVSSIRAFGDQSG